MPKLNPMKGQAMLGHSSHIKDHRPAPSTKLRQGFDGGDKGVQRSCDVVKFAWSPLREAG